MSHLPPSPLLSIDCPRLLREHSFLFIIFCHLLSGDTWQGNWVWHWNVGQGVGLFRLLLLSVRVINIGHETSGL